MSVLSPWLGKGFWLIQSYFDSEDSANSSDSGIHLLKMLQMLEMLHLLLASLAAISAMANRHFVPHLPTPFEHFKNQPFD
jgi:hypothetical protein